MKHVNLGPLEENSIIHGDAIEIMSQLPNACIDAIVTDPPYGLEFMEKEWDKFGAGMSYPGIGERDTPWPSHFGWNRFRCKKCGHLTHGGSPCECGEPEIVRVDIGRLVAYQSWTTAWATEAYRILKPGAYMLVMGGTRTHHRLGCGLEDAGFEIRDELTWIYASGFPKNYDVSKGIDKRAGAERKVVGIKPGHEEFAGRETDGHILAFKGTLGGPGGFDRPWMEDDEKRERYHHKTAPTTPEAQYWDGYGTALKPAHEPIWLAKKPNEGTYVDNVLKHGCGAMNIDGSRVAYYRSAEDEDLARGRERNVGFFGKAGENKYSCPSGRWPANVIVDCYPEEFQGGVVIERSKWEDVELCDGLFGRYYTHYFIIPKPSKSEKDKGCEEFYWRREKGGHTQIGRKEWEKLVAEEKRIYEETGKRIRLQDRGNIHVTVKPVRLGIWLTKLITPHQHPTVVLDPFCGSGSFLVSSIQLNWHEQYQISYLGIDKDANNIIVSQARVAAGSGQLQLL